MIDSFEHMFDRVFEVVFWLIGCAFIAMNVIAYCTLAVMCVLFAVSLMS